MGCVRCKVAGAYLKLGVEFTVSHRHGVEASRSLSGGRETQWNGDHHRHDLGRDMNREGFSGGGCASAPAVACESTDPQNEATTTQLAQQQHRSAATFARTTPGCGIQGCTAEDLQTHRSLCRGERCDGVEQSQMMNCKAPPDRSHTIPAATTTIDKKGSRGRPAIVNRRLKLTLVKAQKVRGDLMLKPLFETTTEPQGLGDPVTPTTVASGPQGAVCGTRTGLQQSFLSMCATLQIS